MVWGGSSFSTMCVCWGGGGGGRVWLTLNCCHKKDSTLKTGTLCVVSLLAACSVDIQ